MPGSVVDHSKDGGLGSLLSPLLDKLRATKPDLASAALHCAIPRWFDYEVAWGICRAGEPCPVVEEGVFEALKALPFCEPHPTRAATWTIRKDFRSYFLTRPELAAHWQALHTQAAELFQRKLREKGLAGDSRFQDPDWRLVLAEWLYHLFQVDQAAGLAELTRICAEALAVPVYQGPSWEIDFCVRLLADLEWPAGNKALDSAIADLKGGFDFLAAGQNAKAVALVKRLADVPGLAPHQAGELYYFAGNTHIDEGKMGPALDELEQAAQLMPNRACVYASISVVHRGPGTSAGRLDLAGESAREAIRVEPGQAEGYVALGRLYELQEAWEQAIVYYREAAEVEPGDIEGHLALSDAYGALRQVTRAIDLIDKAWTISPGSEYFAAIRKGNIYAGNREFDKARQAYETAITLGPDQPATYLALGRFCEQVGETAKAAEMYGRAIELDPATEDGTMALAGLFASQEKLYKAIEVCQRSVANGAAGKGIYFSLSDLYDQLERLSDVEEVREKLVALDWLERYASYCAVASAWLARVRRHPNAADRPLWLAQAQANVDRAISFDKNRAWAYLVQGDLRVLRGQVERLDEIVATVIAQTPWAEYDLLVALGQACLQTFDGATCEKYLDSAVTREPQRLAGWYALSDLSTWQGDVAGVARAWERLVELDPALRYDSYLAVGNAYKRVGDITRARQQYDQAIGLEPGTPNAYISAAAAAEAAGDPEQAIRYYQTAAEKASGLAPLGLVSIARLQRNQGAFQTAEETLRRAIDLDPDEPATSVELACLGAMRDRQDLIDEAVARAASLPPDWAYLLYSSLGDTYRLTGRLDEARQTFDQGIERDPDRAEAYAGLAQVCMAQGDLERARALAVKAIEIDGASVVAYTVLSQLCEANDDVEGVFAAQKRIAEIDPAERYNASITIGAICEKTGDLLQAEQRYREALALCPWRPDAYVYCLGLMLPETGRSGQVIELFEKARAEADLDYWALGFYLENTGNTENALKIYHIALDFAPTLQDRYDLFLASARLHNQLDQMDEAAEDLNRAIALDSLQVEGYARLMLLHADRDRLDDAVQVCRRMAEQPQLAYSADVSLGVLLAAQQAYGAAEEAFRRAIEAAPEQAEAYDQLAQLLAGQERYGEAAQVYRQMAMQPALDCGAHLLLGDLWVRQGNAREATQAYRQAIKVDPRRPAGYLRLAQLYLEQGQPDRAEKPLLDALRLTPDSPDPSILLARCREQQGNVDEAIDLYRRVAQLDPTSASAAYERIGNLLKEEKRYEEAVAALQRAVQQDPANADAYFSLGTIYEQQGNLEQAITNYSRVVDANPDYLDAYISLGQLYGRQGKKQALESTVRQLLSLDLEPSDRYVAYTKTAELFEAAGEAVSAESSYQNAIDSDPAQPEGYVRLMTLLATQGRLDDAMQVCHRMAEQPALAYSADVSLGNLLVAQQAYGEAEKVFRRAIEAAPEQAEAYDQLAQFLAGQERYGEAAQVYRQMAMQPPLVYASHLLLGDLWARQDKVREATQAYRQAIKVDRRRPAGYLRLAQLYLEQGQPDRAEKPLLDALRLTPDSPDPSILLARCREQQGNVDEAIDLYRRVAQLDPTSASAAYERIGNLLKEEKRYEEAVAALQRAVQQDPANADAHFSLGTIYEQQGNLEQAVAIYTNVIDANPDYLDAIAALIRVHGQSKEIAKLAQRAEQLLGKDLQPADLYSAHMVIGFAYHAAEAFEWAMNEFRAAQALDPSRTEAIVALGSVYEQQRRWADARDSYGKLIELVPEWRPDVYRRLGDLFVQEGELAKAEAEYRKAIAAAPERPEGTYGLAGLYMAQEDWPKAAEAWEQITRFKDADPEATSSAFLYLADVRRTLGDEKGKVTACSEVIALVDRIETPNPDLLRQKGLAFFMQDEYDEASAALQACLAAAPQDVKAHFYLALNLLCQGHRAEADRRLELGRQYIKVGTEFASAIREASVLAARTPEIAGAKEMLDALMAAAARM